MSEHPIQDGYKTLCDDCTEHDEPPKQIGPVRPDTNIGRVRADIDREYHRHQCETTTTRIRPKTVAGFVFDEVEDHE